MTPTLSVDAGQETETESEVPAVTVRLPGADGAWESTAGCCAHAVVETACDVRDERLPATS